jgi:hypothetical protein
MMGMDALSRQPVSLLFVLALLFVPLASCNSTNPVEPGPTGPTSPPPSPGSGSDSYSINVTSDPAAIPPGSQTPAKITITAVSLANGQPAPDGTTGAITTNLGSFRATGSPLTATEFTLAGGTKTIDFFPGTQAGTANLLIQVGSTSRGFSLPIQIPIFFLSSITPNLGTQEGGTEVRIAGGGFISPIRVTFNNVVATDARVRDENTIVATAPRSPTPVDAGTTLTVSVVVTNALNQPTPASDTLAGGYTYINGPVVPQDRPVVFSVVPAGGRNAGGESVTILGTGFVAPVQVFFGFQTATGFDGAQGQVQSVSATEIKVRTPAASGIGATLFNELVDVQVLNQGTGFSTISHSAFRYGDDLFITNVSPRSVPAATGGRVAITGRGFSAPVEVKLAGVVQPNGGVDVESDTRIVVNAQGITTTGCTGPSGPVSVTNLRTGQTATSSITFSYTVDGSFLQSLTPTSGRQQGGDPVTISGTFPTSLSRVRVEFGGVASPSVSGSTSQLNVTTPPFTGSFPTIPCDDNGDGTQGTRFQARAVDVVVTDQSTGCADTLLSAFSYNPSDTSCRSDLGPPVANFDFDYPSPQNNPRTVKFFNRSTGGRATRFEWRFGDSTTSTLENPVHAYGADGTYNVTLTVTNAAGTSSVTQPVRVPFGVSP